MRLMIYSFVEIFAGVFFMAELVCNAFSVLYRRQPQRIPKGCFHLAFEISEGV